MLKNLITFSDDSYFQRASICMSKCKKRFSLRKINWLLLENASMCNLLHNKVNIRLISQMLWIFHNATSRTKNTHEIIVKYFPHMTKCNKEGKITANQTTRADGAELSSWRRNIQRNATSAVIASVLMANLLIMSLHFLTVALVIKICLHRSYLIKHWEQTLCVRNWKEGSSTTGSSMHCSYFCVGSV